MPEIILPDHKDLLELYYTSWNIALNNVTHNHDMPINTFMKEGFDQDNIYFWDTAFMTLYGKYGESLLPSITSMDNFYNIQEADGYIPRCYNIKTKSVNFSGPGTNINPPLAAWSEYESCKQTGDLVRVRRILPHLIRFDGWIEKNRRRKDGTWWFSDCAACGMDNSPRTARRNKYGNDVGYIDLAAQQALSAECIARLAEAIGKSHIVSEFDDKYKERKAFINAHHWCEKDGFYYDLLLQGQEHEHYPAYFSSAKTIAAFWPMLAGVTDPDKVTRLLGHLNNPNEFNCRYPVPSLSIDNPNYLDNGRYWQGGVWAPTNYMVVRGLIRCGQYATAREISLKHIYQMISVYRDFTPHSIWECYSPECAKPARNERGQYVRKDFCGWSALGPIAMLIEAILGLEIDYPGRKITWRSNFVKEHGIRNLKFGPHQISLIAKERKSINEVPVLITDLPAGVTIKFEIVE